MKTIRLRSMLIAIIIIFIVLCSIILNIAVLHNKTLSKMASVQRENTVEVKKYRNAIYDKSLIPLVDQRSYIYSMSNGITSLYNDNDSGIIYNTTKRYDDRTLCRHLIGYLDSDGIGISGLEKKFDTLLKTNEKYTFTAVMDALNNPISSIGVQKTNDIFNGKKNVKLTLDYHVQKIVEQNMDEYELNGAVVVLDTKTFDVLAMASRPNFDQNSIDKYIDSNGGELINKALSAYNAGSIFKIITLSSALENGACSIDDMTYCSGSTDVSGILFNCLKLDGHGDISYKDAFAQSCNSAFYSLGQTIGSAKIVEMAKRFSYGLPLLNIKGIAEQSGNIPEKDNYFDADNANIAIGQGEILVTPLQVANMVCIIANGGNAKSVNIVDSIVDSAGKTTQNLRKMTTTKVIDESIAKEVGRAMLETTLTGTGQSTNLSDLGGIAGKTSSAETGWIDENGSLMVHGWFCGFFPYENPKYAMVVFAQDGRQGNSSCGPVFKSISTSLLELNS